MTYSNAQLSHHDDSSHNNNRTHGLDVINCRRPLSRPDLHGDKPEVDPPGFSCTFRTAVLVSFIMHLPVR